MKKLVAFALAGLLCTAGANAAVLTFDNFDYPDGPLVPNGGWASHSGVAGDMLVSGGQVVVQHGAPSEDANKAFTPSTGVIYYGLDFTVGDLGAPYVGTDFEYFAHLKDDGTNFAARLDVVAPSGGGDFSVGISSDQSTADVTWPTDLAYDTTYRAVVKYDQDANQAQMWIDALVDTDPSILGFDQPDPGDSITQFALRQSDSSENETVFVDGLVVGTMFSDVVNAVPEPASLALLALGAVTVIRRKR